MDTTASDVRRGTRRGAERPGHQPGLRRAYDPVRRKIERWPTRTIDPHHSPSRQSPPPSPHLGMKLAPSSRITPGQTPPGQTAPDQEAAGQTAPGQTAVDTGPPRRSCNTTRCTGSARRRRYHGCAVLHSAREGDEHGSTGRRSAERSHARRTGRPGGDRVRLLAVAGLMRRARWLARSELAAPGPRCWCCCYRVVPGRRSARAVCWQHRGPGFARLRGGLVVPGQPRRPALAGARGPGRRAVFVIVVYVIAGLLWRSRWPSCSRSAPGPPRHRSTAGAPAARAGRRRSSGLRDHEPEVGRREGRQVRARRQGHHARRWWSCLTVLEIVDASRWPAKR